MKYLFLKLSIFLMVITLFYSCEVANGEEVGDTVYVEEESVPEEHDEIIDMYEPVLETYDQIIENEFIKTQEENVSTFSVDVDRASYSNVRRFLTQNQELPPRNAVRTEELINYFKYDYPQPTGEDPLSISTEITACPWNKDNRLALIGLQGKSVSAENIPPSNLVFLIDVSGSMGQNNKLPLLKEAFIMLTDKMRPEDRVAIVVYADGEGIVLNSTPGNEKNKIKSALNNLNAGGSTAGSAGINLAYQVVQDNFIKGGTNRVILATDGDFNVGPSTDDELVGLIENKRDEGVFLSVLGFGMGNYKDSKMEKLADNGNGNYAYIDNLNEAKKVLITEMGSTLYTIAKDVKLQVEFDSKYVESYRLIGYENRVLAKRDFDNDQKDAGDMGAGHTVTALYEIVPKKNVKNKKLMDIKFRYKNPDENESLLLQTSAMDNNTTWSNASKNMTFAASVASFSMLLRDSQYKGNTTFDKTKIWAMSAKGADLEGYRSEFINLIDIAKDLKEQEVNY